MAVNLAEIYPTKCAEIESALLCATQSESITQPDQNNAETTVIF
jgi:hypothetical protein